MNEKLPQPTESLSFPPSLQDGVIIASSSPQKIKRVNNLIVTNSENKFLSPEIFLDIEEGGNEFENAQKKAQEYALVYNKPALGWDDGLYIHGLDSPGAHIKRLDDGTPRTNEEIFRHYHEIFSNLSPEHRKGYIKRALALAGPDGTMLSTVVVIPVSFVVDGNQPNLESNPLDTMIIPDGFYVPFSEFTPLMKKKYDNKLLGGVQALFSEYDAICNSRDTRRSIANNGVTWVFSNPNLRLFSEEDAEQVALMSGKIADFYAGHTHNWVVEQYGITSGDGTDPNGFMTKRRLLMVFGGLGSPRAMLALVIKRGQTLKTNTMRVADNYQRQGLGRLIKQESIWFAQATGIRGVYCTTNLNNEGAYNLNRSLGFEPRAIFPDHYVEGGAEVVLSLLLKPSELITEFPEGKGMLVEGDDGDREILQFNSAVDREQFSKLISENFSLWHDDVGEDFVDATVRGAQRGLDIVKKGKIILVAKNNDGNMTGVGVLTMKRGGPAKLDPLIGDEVSLNEIVEAMKKIAKENGGRKIYTFVPSVDSKALDLLGYLGFSPRGRLKEPYKPGVDLDSLDIFL